MTGGSIPWATPCFAKPDRTNPVCRAKFDEHRLQMAEREWKRMKQADSRECRNCHNFEYMDFTEQKSVASNYRQGTIVNTLPLWLSSTTDQETDNLSTWIQGSFELPKSRRSLEIALISISICATLPANMVSAIGRVTAPFSIRKLFLATAEKSPFLAGSPPEMRLISKPLSIEAIISCS